MHTALRYFKIEWPIWRDSQSEKDSPSPKSLYSQNLYSHFAKEQLQLTIQWMCLALIAVTHLWPNAAFSQATQGKGSARGKGVRESYQTSYSSASAASVASASHANGIYRDHSEYMIGYRFVIGGLQTKSENSQATLGKTELELNLSYLPTSWFALHLIPIAFFESGSQQNISQTPQDQANKVVLKKAVAEFRFLEAASLSVGVQDLQETHQKLLFESRSFPGARGQYIYEINNVQQFGLFAETLIPTSAGLSTNTSELEPTPLFFSAGAQYLINFNSRSRHKAQVNYFEFKDLTNSTVATSGLQGNEVNYISEVEASFPHLFKGLEAALSTNWIVTKEFDLGGWAFFVHNTGAETSQEAYLLGGSITYHLDSVNSIALAGIVFRLEPNSVVAAYAPRRFGYANRNGYGMELSYSLKKPEVKISGGWVESDSIYVSPTQFKENSIYLKVEVSHAAF